MDYPTFKKLASELTGIDLSSYKSQQMDRRINALKQFWNIETYDDFLTLLKTNPQKYKEFVNRLTINVSEFFRNPERFADLHLKVLPELLQRNSIVRIWSAGCSDGSEPYSVAIIAKELQAENRVKILATDVDKEIINKAIRGVYNPGDLKNLPQELINKYFDLENNQYYLKDSIKKMVIFKYHNLLLDPFETNFDLIICRNVVIYFTEEAKNKLYQKFINSLKLGGYFMVGGTEPLLFYHQLGLENPLTSFYRKHIY